MGEQKLHYILVLVGLKLVVKQNSEMEGDGKRSCEWEWRPSKRVCLDHPGHDLMTVKPYCADALIKESVEKLDMYVLKHMHAFSSYTIFGVANMGFFPRH